MKTREIATAALLLGSTLFAQTPQKSKSADCCSSYRIPDKALCGVPPAYNIPARITACNDRTFEVDASFLYWCIVQDYMDYGTTAVLAAMDAPADPDNKTVAVTPNQYQPGFRVGIGSGHTFDDWETHFGYTFMHRTKTFTTGNTTDVAAIPLGGAVYQLNEWFENIPDAPVAIGGFSNTWQMDYNGFDLTLARPFYQGQRLTVTPYSGLYGLYIQQSFNVNAYQVDEVIDFSNNSAKAWGIGPEVGANLNWLIGSGFRFEADAKFALPYVGYYAQNHSEEVAGAASAGSVGSIGYLRTFYDLALGFGWGSYWSSYHFDLFAGYEFVSLAGQNVMRKNVGLLGGFAHADGDLQFHGLTVSARFDF